MKYLVLQKFRLTDQSIYLDAGMVFEPEDNYARTSRSMAAAVRAGWLRKISDAEAEKIEAKAEAREPKAKKSAAAKAARKIDAPVGVGVEMKPEDLADEVISGDDILAARKKRREDRVPRKSKTTAKSIKDEVKKKASTRKKRVKKIKS